MKGKANLILALSILVYTGWTAGDLYEAWRSAPLEKYSFYLFLAWLLPIPASMFSACAEGPCERYHPYLLGAALFCAFLGQIASLNFICYIGFAINLSAFVPFRPSGVPWLFSSLCWMPAFGWLGSHYFPAWQLLVRSLLVIVCLALWWIFQNEGQKRKKRGS